jgi:hypothetical protein
MVLQVNLEKDTVWLNQKQITLLFDRDRTVINKHINNVFREGELDKNSVCAFFAHTAKDRKTYETQFLQLRCHYIRRLSREIKTRDTIPSMGNPTVKRLFGKRICHQRKRLKETENKFINLINNKK